MKGWLLPAPSITANKYLMKCNPRTPSFIFKSQQLSQNLFVLHHIDLSDTHSFIYLLPQSSRLESEEQQVSIRFRISFTMSLQCPHSYLCRKGIFLLFSKISSLQFLEDNNNKNKTVLGCQKGVHQTLKLITAAKQERTATRLFPCKASTRMHHLPPLFFFFYHTFPH